MATQRTAEHGVYWLEERDEDDLRVCRLLAAAINEARLTRSRRRDIAQDARNIGLAVSFASRVEEDGRRQLLLYTLRDGTDPSVLAEGPARISSKHLPGVYQEAA